MKLTRKTIVALLFISQIIYAQQVNGQNAQFSEMTTLEHFGGPSSGTYKPTDAEKQRIAWWRDAKFGMFVHWGLFLSLIHI